MKQFLCIDCWHEILSDRQPQTMTWSDGHVCTFKSPEDIDTSLILSYEDFIASLERGGDGRIDLSDGDFPEIELRNAYDTEVKMMLRYALKAKLPSISLHPFRVAGNQHIAEFEVNDKFVDPDPSKINWHGQNTSQWMYAGCILYDQRDNRVSRHH